MRMLRFVCLCVAVLIAQGVQAQEPLVTVTLPEDPVMVGQPYVVRVDVLVPTFMPDPPVFPTFEVPGLLVRLPERSTSPISDTVSGATWSGVRRTYRIYPMQAGKTEIPAQQVQIVYKDDATNDDLRFAGEVPPIEIVATVPEGAEALDPLVIAGEITVTQSWQVAEGELSVGDAVVRRLEIDVAEGSALFVPPLLETARPVAKGETEAAADPFLAYPEDAVVSESFDRGVMSGARVEETSYIAQVGGDVTFPEIRLQWFKIDGGTVEDIVLEGREVTVAMPPVTRDPIDWRAVAGWAVLAALAGLIILGLRRWAWPPLAAQAGKWRAAYAKTARAAHAQALRHARDQDLSGLLAALETRRNRGQPVGDAVLQALHGLTRTVYRDGGSKDMRDKNWTAVLHALKADAPHLWRRSRRKAAPTLPALNGFSESKRPDM